MPPVVRREVNAEPPSLSSITGRPCLASAVSISAHACSCSPPVPPGWPESAASDHRSAEGCTPQRHRPATRWSRPAASRRSGLGARSLEGGPRSLGRPGFDDSGPDEDPVHSSGPWHRDPRPVQTSLDRPGAMVPALCPQLLPLGQDHLDQPLRCLIRAAVRSRRARQQTRETIGLQLRSISIERVTRNAEVTAYLRDVCAALVDRLERCDRDPDVHWHHLFGHD